MGYLRKRSGPQTLGSPIGYPSSPVGKRLGISRGGAGSFFNATSVCWVLIGTRIRQECAFADSVGGRA